MTFDKIIVMACENDPQTTTTSTTTTTDEGTTTSTTTDSSTTTSTTTEEEPATTTSTTTEALVDFREHVSEQVDARIAGQTPAVAEPVFSTQDHGIPTYIRNVSGWGYAVDLTPVSPWNSHQVQVGSGILISPRHVLLATHVGVIDTSTIRFVTSDNTVVTRTISAQQTLGHDTTIAVLDSDVPGTISFARVLPTNWASYFSGSPAGVPVAYFDQEEKLLVADLKSFNQSWLARALVTLDEPTDPDRNGFFETLVGGDSGNPICLLVNGQLVVLGAFTYGANPPDWEAGAGDSVANYYASINAAMTALGGGYQLTDVDMSGFITYP